MDRRVFLILGMHRSGTSSLAGLLHHCGIPSGTRLMPPRAENPKGFYEPWELYKLNEDLLGRSGSTWHHLTFDPLKDLPVPQYEAAKQEVKTLLHEEFEETSSSDVLLKEPRVSVLLSLYLDGLEDMGWEVVPIVLKRDFYSIARSLQKRNHFSMKKGYQLSHIYYRSIFQGLERASYEPYVVSFDKQIEAPKEVIQGILDFAKIKVDEERLERALDEFHDPELRHNSKKSLWDRISATWYDTLYGSS